MRTSTLLLRATLLVPGAIAELTYTAKMTYHGVEVPVEFTTMPHRYGTPVETALTEDGTNATNKRSGPISVTTNWAGAIQEAPSSGVFRSISAEWRVPGFYSPWRSAYF